MPFVALMCPAAISLAIYRKRREYKPGVIDSIAAYLIFVLVINLLTMCTTVYLLRVYDSMQSFMEGFVFFTKYVIIATVFALIIPSLYDLFTRYFKISFDDKVKSDRNEKK